MSLNINNSVQTINEYSLGTIEGVKGNVMVNEYINLTDKNPVTHLFWQIKCSIDHGGWISDNKLKEFSKKVAVNSRSTLRSEIDERIREISKDKTFAAKKVRKKLQKEEKELTKIMRKLDNRLPRTRVLARNALKSIASIKPVELKDELGDLWKDFESDVEKLQNSLTGKEKDLSIENGQFVKELGTHPRKGRVFKDLKNYKGTMESRRLKPIGEYDTQIAEYFADYLTARMTEGSLSSSQIMAVQDLFLELKEEKSAKELNVFIERSEKVDLSKKTKIPMDDPLWNDFFRYSGIRKEVEEKFPGGLPVDLDDFENINLTASKLRFALDIAFKKYPDLMQSDFKAQFLKHIICDMKEVSKSESLLFFTTDVGEDGSRTVADLPTYTDYTLGSVIEEYKTTFKSQLWNDYSRFMKIAKKYNNSKAYGKMSDSDHKFLNKFLEKYMKLQSAVNTHDYFTSDIPDIKEKMDIINEFHLKITGWSLQQNALV